MNLTHARIASNVLADAERLTKPFSNATPVLVDTNDSAAVERLIAEADVVIRYVFVAVYPNVRN